MSEHTRIGSGRTAEVYAINDDKVLKLFHPSVSEATVQKEYDVSKRLVAMDMPVPTVFRRIEKDNRKGIVYEYIKGTAMTEVIAKKPWKARKAARLLANLHLNMHAHSVSSFPRFKDVLRVGIDRSGLDARLKEKLQNTLDGIKDATILCHGDFHPDNILWKKQSIHIIDWLDATCGHPLLDVARTKMLLEHSALPDDLGRFEKRIVTIIRRSFLRTYLKTYFKRSAYDKDALVIYEPIVMAARMSETIPDQEKDVIRDALIQKVNI